MHDEKRGSDRGYTMLYVTLFDGGQFRKELIQDTGPGGLMIKSSQPCDVGTLLGLVIHAHVPIRAMGAVAWVKKDGDMYKIGIEFKELNADARAGWVDLLNRS